MNSFVFLYNNCYNGFVSLKKRYLDIFVIVVQKININEDKKGNGNVKILCCCFYCSLV